MAVAPAVDEDSDHGEVGQVVVLVAALLGGPPEDVEGETRVGLCPQGLVDLDRGKPGFQVVNPCLELLLQRRSGPGWGRSNWVFGFGVLGRGRDEAVAEQRVGDREGGFRCDVARGDRWELIRERVGGSESGGEQTA